MDKRETVEILKKMRDKALNEAEALQAAIEAILDAEEYIQYIIGEGNQYDLHRD